MCVYERADYTAPQNFPKNKWEITKSRSWEKLRNFSPDVRIAAFPFSFCKTIYFFNVHVFPRVEKFCSTLEKFQYQIWTQPIVNLLLGKKITSWSQNISHISSRLERYCDITTIAETTCLWACIINVSIFYNLKFK